MGKRGTNQNQLNSTFGLYLSDKQACGYFMLATHQMIIKS